LIPDITRSGTGRSATGGAHRRRGRAVDGVRPDAVPPRRWLVIDRDRGLVRDDAQAGGAPAAFPGRRDHHDVVTVAPEPAGQHAQPAASDPVIIGDQDPHDANLLTTE
jgi:hypothetical protein